jgi:hypothetical protein
MGDGVGAGHLRDLDLALGDQRTGDRGPQEIGALVQRVAAKHGKDEVANELLAQVFDEDLLDPHHLGLLAGGLELLALAQVGGEGHDLAIVGVLQPAQDDRRVQAARIRQNNLLHRLGHLRNPFARRI